MRHMGVGMFERLAQALQLERLQLVAAGALDRLEFGGAYRNPFSFLEFSKQLIDQLNAWHSRDEHSFTPDGFTESADSMHYYDSVLVIEKRRRQPPRMCKSGQPVFEGDEKGEV